ncbi:MAG TPA: TetR/AcrR family transcriptional regulator [Burkholderiales bacterium]|jgi:TetR/AcrR family transcriptional repressor of nem operon|nr:TetR/AcrR family transcriptional regulator [Burkholderiales bacterium]
MMRKDGIATRERILDAAQHLILDRGYVGMTVEHVLDEVDITKGAFFHHFKTKDDLAKALLRRFAEKDAQIYEATRERAEKLSDDPLEQLLIFVRLFEEMFDGLTEPYPGCLFASYIYELQQFDDETRTLIHGSFMKWRDLLKEKFEVIARKYPPRIQVDAASLADVFTVVLEGAFISSKALDEPQLIGEQLRHFRNYVELLFRPPKQ